MSAAALLNSSGKLAAEYFAYPAPVGGIALFSQPGGAATPATATINLEPGFYLMSIATEFSGAGATAGSFEAINIFKSAGTATLAFGGQITVPAVSVCTVPSTSDATKTTAQVLASANGFYNNSVMYVDGAGTATFTYVPCGDQNYGANGGMNAQITRISQ
jgi:hypothetical protein